MTALVPLLGLALLLRAATAGADTGATVPPGWRPPAASDEAGLWMLADRAEAALRTSGLVVRDAAVTAHVAAVACRVAGLHCADVRIHVIRAPRANATMAPNGALVVSTGLLLRTASEAQLAYVLGHEVGHYVRRHGIRSWRDQADRAAAGYLLGQLGLQSLAWLGTGLFSREQESEADALALRLMARAGYDPQQAVAFLEAWLAPERAAPPVPRGGVLASHPLTADRLAAARAAATRPSPAAGPAAAGEPDAHRRALAPVLGGLLQDQLRLREPAVSLDLAERLLAAGAEPGPLHYFRGEVYRQRGEAGDEAAALAWLEAARATASAPAEVHRALGLLHMKRAEAEQARACFTRYLEERPDAEDRAMVEAYLARLGGGQ